MKKFGGMCPRVRASFLVTLSATVTVFCGPAFSQIIQKVEVTGGEIEGVVKHAVASFKGIPFAAPPIGELRNRIIAG